MNPVGEMKGALDAVVPDLYLLVQKWEQCSPNSLLISGTMGYSIVVQAHDDPTNVRYKLRVALRDLQNKIEANLEKLR